MPDVQQLLQVRGPARPPLPQVTGQFAQRGQKVVEHAGVQQRVDDRGVGHERNEPLPSPRNHHCLVTIRDGRTRLSGAVSQSRSYGRSPSTRTGLVWLATASQSTGMEPHSREAEVRRLFVSLSMALAALLFPFAGTGQAQTTSVGITDVTLVRGDEVRITGVIECPVGSLYSLSFEVYQRSGLTQAIGRGGDGEVCQGVPETFVVSAFNGSTAAFRRGPATLTSSVVIINCEFGCQFYTLLDEQRKVRL